MTGEIPRGEIPRGEILRFPEPDVPAALRAQVERLHAGAFGSAGAHDPALAPESMLLVADGAVLAALDILRKEIGHAGTRWAAAGLSAVVTAPAARRRGLGLQLVAAARGAMAADGLDLAVFTCDRELAGFYERAGFALLPGSVLVGGTPADPFPSDTAGFDKVVLGEFFSARARAARADFAGARIAVFPGGIDRLW